MKIFDRYMFKNLMVATLFIAFVLTIIIFLTQSLRLLDLVLNTGLSGSTFWILTLLALPRFFEVILPIAVMAATLFIYNKMNIDSEITAMRATGYSPYLLGRSGIKLAALITLILWVIAMWITPLSMSKMHKMRTALTSEISSILFKEGIFNQVGSGLTIYIKERTENGELAGLMIHDTRDENALPSTVLAKRGLMIMENNTQQIVVYDGSRQQFDPQSKILQRLAFDRYTIDIPMNGTTDTRWSEPEERTINALLNPDLNNPDDVKYLREFKVEIHRRITAPILALVYTLIALNFLLLGNYERRGQTKKIIACVIMTIILQGLYLAVYNIGKNADSGLALMYIMTIIPLLICVYLLSHKSEDTRYKILSALKLKLEGVRT